MIDLDAARLAAVLDDLARRRAHVDPDLFMGGSGVRRITRLVARTPR